MRVLVGITGGVAAYKAAEIVRSLTELGHEVRVIATTNALRFIGAASLEALSKNTVSTDLYADIPDVRHIELAKWPDAILVAPATASFLARTAGGLADDLLGNVLLATVAPVVIAPAMHTEMWFNAATLANVEVLRSRGLLVIEPASGRLTGSDTGIGRLPDPEQLVQAVVSSVTPKDLTGKKVLVVAGGTREYIDPVRYIGNRSSGRQGVALVEEAIARGAQVTLVAANFTYSSSVVEVHGVETTQELIDCLQSLDQAFDYVVMPAAVSDYRLKSVSPSKLKKDEGSLELDLIENPDVISGLAVATRLKKSHAKIVGFAAETASGEELISLATAKMTKKILDLIVANDVTGGSGFDSDENTVHIVSANEVMQFTGSKREIASKIFTALAN
jgi:phosphopantothenoylcysteine decarboxylase/phosphopantothenate--cysteine ligase